MNQRNADLLKIASIIVVMCVLSITCFLKPQTEYSKVERRKLARKPKLSLEAVMNGTYREEFERYALDQFPKRDAFRSMSTMKNLYLLGKKDTNDLYLTDGNIVKMEYPYHPESVEHALHIFQNIEKTMLKDSDCKSYFAIIPDKNYYLAKESGHLLMDYDAMYQDLENGLPNVAMINLSDTLSAESYYKTDIHFKQEKVLSCAKKIADVMQAEMDSFEEEATQMPFYGVYYGQLGLNVEPDEIVVLRSNMLNDCTVYDYQNQKEGKIYDMEKLSGKDPYDVYLGGPLSLVEITNPNATSDRELVVFRDSFGSSLVPLLAKSYHKITLVDVRYMPSAYVGNFIKFDKQDVLFLYSTTILNNSEVMK